MNSSSFCAAALTGTRPATTGSPLGPRVCEKSPARSSSVGKHVIRGAGACAKQIEKEECVCRCVQLGDLERPSERYAEAIGTVVGIVRGIAAQRVRGGIQRRISHRVKDRAVHPVNIEATAATALSAAESALRQLAAAAHFLNALPR